MASRPDGLALFDGLLDDRADDNRQHRGRLGEATISEPEPSQAEAGYVEVYVTDVAGVPSRGVSYDGDQLDAVLRARVVAVLWDDAGRAGLQEVLDGVPSTDFAAGRLTEVLNWEPAIEDWRVGEALGEAYLVAECSCEFPWPMGRDLRNPSGSASGADLVGFSTADGSARFAFGEVKTSTEERWPPQVMYSRTGLVAQLEKLRDEVAAKDHLVRYLGFHAQGATWLETYQRASERFLANVDDIALHGILVRDVEPRSEDLSARTRALSDGMREPTTIELRAKYLPAGTLETIVERVRQIRSES